MIIVNGRKKKLETAMRKPPENAMMPQAEPKHIGGGWYELSNGEKVRGKDKALEMMSNE